MRCAVPGCDKPVWSRGWCQPHCRRWYRTGSVTRTLRRAADVVDAAELHAGTAAQLAAQLGYKSTRGLRLALQRAGREDLIERLASRTPDPTPKLTAIIGAAACVGTDPEVFFNPDTEAEAISICNGCPVRVKCLDWALSYGPSLDLEGIFGGLTAEQRHAIRPRNRPQP